MRRASTLKGYSLIEVMVALTVLTIGMLGIIGLQSQVVNSTRSSQDLTNANNLLQFRMDELSILDPLALPGLCLGPATGCRTPNATANPVLPPGGCRVITVNPQPLGTNGLQPIPPDAAGKGGPYTIDTGLVVHAGANHPGSFVATVSVCWAERNGRVRQVQSTRVFGLERGS